MIDESTVASLRQQDPELADIIRKWSPKLENVINAVRRVTGDGREDIEQSYLLKIVTVAHDYRKPQIRFIKGGKRQLWTILSETKEEYTATRGRHTRTLLKSDCEVIRRASLSTMVFTGIIQHTSDLLGRYFKAKNGFVRGAVEDGLVFNRAKRTYVTATRGKYVRTVTEVPLIVSDDDGESFGLDMVAGLDPEQMMLLAERIKDSGQGLITGSSLARVVYQEEFSRESVAKMLQAAIKENT